MNVYIFTASRPEAKKCYEISIENPVPVKTLYKHLKDDFVNHLSKKSENNRVYAWGATPGPRLIPIWNSMNAGDRVIGYRKKKLVCTSKILGKDHNKPFAKDVWGIGQNPDNRGQTWEYVYFLDEIQKISADPPRLYRGHTKLSNDEAYEVLKRINIPEESSELEDSLSKQKTEEVEEKIKSEVKKRIESGDFQTPDTWSKTKTRIGQREFREEVLDNFHNRCCVCGLNIPELLEAAHIRGWDEDKNNRLNPMNGLTLCRLHHVAWSRGIIEIKNDRSIEVNPNYRKTSNKAAKRYLLNFEGRKIEMPKKDNLLL